VGELAIYRRLMGARIRAEWQYRLSFTLFAVAQFFVTTLDLLTIAVIFHNVPSLAGWSLDEVTFLYDTSSLAFAIGDTFVSPVDRCGLYIKQGTFDQFLVRPVRPLLQILAGEFELRRSSKILQALIVLVVAAVRLPITWTAGRVAMTVVLLGAGAAIFASFWVIVAAMTFWTVDSQDMGNAFTSGGNFLTQYPVDVYASWLRRLLLIVPLAFVNYLPAVWILGRSDVLHVPAALQFASPVVGAVALAVAGWAWGTAIRHYRSAGS
jgi:ABC-2 type transport system permease protein